MAAGKIAEVNYNAALADQLARRLPSGKVTPQATGLLERARLMPDVYIQLPGSVPIILECKYDLPGYGKAVEAAASKRLGLRLEDSGQTIQQTIAVLYPRELQSHPRPREQALEHTIFKYAVLFDNPNGPVRFPAAGWLTGDLDDLASLVENVALTTQPAQGVLAKLELAVTAAAAQLGSQEQTILPIDRQLGQILHQAPSQQTTLLALTVVLNAMVFQSSVAANYTKVQSVTELADKAASEGRSLTANDVLGGWHIIIKKINYRAVFDIATEVLQAISEEPQATAVLGQLAGAAMELSQLTVPTIQQLTGQLFARLVSNRKALDFWPTMTESATLLATLAVDQLSTDWASSAAVQAQRIADFACGTGTLLAATHRRISQLARRHGQDNQELHQRLMEDMLVGADIMPTAAYLTVATLSAEQPSTAYDRTRIHALPYGRQPDGSVKLGSLELISATRSPTLWGSLTQTSSGEPAGSSGYLAVPDHSLDLVIMNPPRTASATESAGVGGGRADNSGVGGGGTVSDFIALGLQKLKPHGVMALVLPAAFMIGAAWEQDRAAIAQLGTNVTVVSLAGSDAAGADGTAAAAAAAAAAEALVIATRRAQPAPDSASEAEDWLWITLNRQPASPTEAAVMAGVIKNARQESLLKPSPLRLGHTEIGTAAYAPAAATRQALG